MMPRIPARRWLESPYAPLVFFPLVFALYAATFSAGWTYDDYPVIVNNPDVQSWPGFLANTYPGRPLRELTYLLDHMLFGMNPEGWRIQQLFWHGLNAVLLVRLARLLALPHVTAWFVGLLFLCHPLQVEVVANLSHRKDSLALAFSLLAILAWLHLAKSVRRKLAWLLLAAGCWLLACSAKQTAVVLPVALALWERVSLPPERRLLWRYPVLWWSGLGAVAAYGVYWLSFAGGLQKYLAQVNRLVPLRTGSQVPLDLVDYGLTLLKSWGFMFKRWLLPFDLALEYSFPVPKQFLDADILLGLLIISLVCAGFVFCLRSGHPALFPLSLFLVFWLPVANLYPLTYLAADRYLYAPSAGVFLLLGLALGGVPVPARKCCAMILGSILLFFAGLTWQQSRVWHSEMTLWQHAATVNPRSSFAQNNLGWQWYLAGDTSQALHYLHRAAENPMNCYPLDNLGYIYEQQQDVASALRFYRAFLNCNSKGPAYAQRARRLREILLQRYGLEL